MNGEPVEGAKITRTGDREFGSVHTQEAISDKNGFYKFDAIGVWSLRQPFFSTNITQEIFIEYQGKKYLGWRKFKANDHHYGELAYHKEWSRATPILCDFPLDKSDNISKAYFVAENYKLGITGLHSLREHEVVSYQ